MFKRNWKRLALALLLCLVFLCCFSCIGSRTVNATPYSESKVVSGGKWVHVTEGTRYRYANGSYASNIWLRISGKLYRINEKGYLCKGWFVWKKAYYYSDTAGRLLYNRVLTIGSAKYYLKSDGTRATKQWQKIRGHYYYFMYNGKLAKNCFVGDYFVNAKGQMIRNTWLRKSGKRYYFGANGKKLKSTWFKYKNKYYYFKADGTLALKQWIKTGKGYYYVNASGVKQVNCIVGGYYLNKSGLRTVKVFKGKRIFLGDSRIVGMQTYACSKTEDLCIAKIGVGYNWLAKTGGPLLKNYLTANPNVTVVLCLGVNDVKGNVNQYIAYYRRLISAFPKTKFYVLSVNPVIEKMWPSVKNSWIEAFNAKMKAAFPTRYINCYDYMMAKKFKTVDGLHYASTTYEAIYKFILTKLA